MKETLGPYFEGFEKGYTEGLGVATKVANNFSLDLSSGNVFDITLTANSTITIASRTMVGTCYSFLLIVHQGASAYTLTGPASFKYPGAVAPTFSISSVNIVSGVTVDGGTTFLVSAAGFAYA